mgnify:CR=1 FL=1
MMTQLRTPVLVVSVAALLAFCAYAVNWLVPFNLTYTKRVKASYLRNEVKEWKMLGEPKSYGHTNETVVSYVWRTNLNVGSGSVSTVMRLDSALFRDRGYLVATSNREVFWVGRDGRAEPMSPK